MPNLGISVEAVVKAKFGPYLDTLSPEERDKKLKEYVDTSKESIQGAIDEAQGLVDSVISTVEGIPVTVTGMIAQVASVAAMVDPSAKAAQATSIVDSISNLKDQLKRCLSQTSSLSNILTQLSMSNPIVDTLNTAIGAASSLLDTIPV